MDSTGADRISQPYAPKSPENLRFHSRLRELVSYIEDVIQVTENGIYCSSGDFYIDPVRPVARAVITHGHADHARAGHGAVLATPETLDIMGERYGLGFAQAMQAAAYGEAVALSEGWRGHIAGDESARQRFV